MRPSFIWEGTNSISFTPQLNSCSHGSFESFWVYQWKKTVGKFGKELLRTEVSSISTFFFFFWLGLVLTELQAGLFVLNFLTEFQTSHLSPQQWPLVRGQNNFNLFQVSLINQRTRNKISQRPSSLVPWQNPLQFGGGGEGGNKLELGIPVWHQTACFQSIEQWKLQGRNGFKEWC